MTCLSSLHKDLPANDSTGVPKSMLDVRHMTNLPEKGGPALCRTRRRGQGTLRKYVGETSVGGQRPHHHSMELTLHRKQLLVNTCAGNQV